MRRVLRQSAFAAAAGAVAAVSALLFGVDRRDLVLDAYLVYLAALAAIAVSRLAAGAFPPPRAVVPAALAPRSARYEAPESLTRIEGLVALAQADQLDYHVRLRPLLSAVAAAGYSARSGAAHEHLPASAERALTPATWSLIRPDRPRPEGPGERGIPTATLAAALDELESILPP